MKRQNWTYLTMKKFAAAVCAAGLLLFTMSAGAGLITFDSLGNAEAPIPDGYAQLQWDNFYSLDGVHYGPSGYQRGVISRDNVAFNASGNPASISTPGGFFTPYTAYVTAAWTDRLVLTVKGYYRGRPVLNRSYILRTTKPTLIKFGVKVDQLVFSTSNNSQIAMDNLQIASVNPGVPVRAIEAE
jgi:hypothetical protein